MNNFHSQFNQETKKEEAAQKATSSWMDNPKLAGIDMSKLAMLNALASVCLTCSIMVWSLI